MGVSVHEIVISLYQRAANAYAFLQLLDVQDVRKIMHFSPNKRYGKLLRSVQDGGIVIDSEGFIYIFNFCVLESK